MSRGAKWAIGCGGAALLVFALFLLLIVMAVFFTPASRTVALVNVSGTIASSPENEGLFGTGGGAERTVATLREAAADDSVAAIVLRINSPGGSAAASQEIYQEVMRCREAKPIIASMGDIAASGGYYIASGCDTIFANPATLTGSIGVIFMSADISHLLERLGTRMEVVKSGKFKDMASFARPMTPAERRLMQGLINDTYEQFVEAVAKGRGMPAARVRELADGRVYSGRQALRLKLVDKLGGLQDAIAYAGERGGIKGAPTVKEMGRKSPMERLLGASVNGWLRRLGVGGDPLAPRVVQY